MIWHNKDTGIKKMKRVLRKRKFMRENDREKWLAGKLLQVGESKRIMLWKRKNYFIYYILHITKNAEEDN